jgi:predicted DsbA family dithiol-disulfide isomerase
MCPWCIIGYKRLEQAMLKIKDAAEFNNHHRRPNQSGLKSHMPKLPTVRIDII